MPAPWHAEAVRMREGGATYREIGERFGRAGCNIYRLFRRLGRDDLCYRRGEPSGLPPGVSQPNERFHARAHIGGKQRHIGAFDTPEEAHAAYLEAVRLREAGGMAVVLEG